jgi:hypothetical protein
MILGLLILTTGGMVVGMIIGALIIPIKLLDLRATSSSSIKEILLPIDPNQDQI